MDADAPDRLTVLFLHGLESGPNGGKARALAAAGFRVVAPALPSGRAHLWRDRALPVAALLVIALAAAPWGLDLAWPLAALSGVLAGLAAGRLGYAWLIRRRHDACHAVAAAAAARLPPRAVVVGSSNGGGLAVRLLMEGLWTGPTVLLCPAQTLVARRALRPTPKLRTLPAAVTSQVLVVHGDADEVVPLGHSEALTSGSAARLQVILGGDHRLAAHATAEGLAAWVAEVVGAEGVAAARASDAPPAEARG